MQQEVKNVTQDLEKRMQGAINNLKHSLNGLRTGRASPNLLDPIKVEAYGDRVPITQIASISASEAQMIVVQVWDASVAKSVDKAIRDSGLGLNPIVEGQTLRIPIPPLSQERRKELAKKAEEYNEAAKVSIRNVRRDAMDHIKKFQKDKVISEDEMRQHSDEVQQMTDNFIKNCDSITKNKITEINGA